jgi:hypothetical protein
MRSGYFFILARAGSGPSKKVIIDTDTTNEVVTNTPPENLQRKIEVYTWVDVEKIKEDFWSNF